MVYRYTDILVYGIQVYWYKLNNILKKHLLLDNHYTSPNSTNLANELPKLTINSKHRLINLDIKDLYVSITIKESIDMTRTQHLKYNDKQTTNQFISLLEVILERNYFSFQEWIYQPEKSMAMGPPISGTMAEIFLQQLENSHIKYLLDS